MNTKSPNVATVWSQTGCANCEVAIRMLEARGYAVEVRKIGVGEAYTKEDLIREVPTARTVPQIVINGQYVGDLVNMRKYLVVK